MKTRLDNETTWAVLALSRFLLASIVAVGHLGLFIKDSSNYVSLARNLDGKAAVIGFLLISGFSIHSSLEKSPAGFVARRLTRVYPLYFVSIIFTILVEVFLGPSVTLPASTLTALGPIVAIGNILLLQMFLVKAIAFNGPLWSLSIEFFYYLLAKYIPGRTAIFLCLAMLSLVVFALPRGTATGAAYNMVTKLNWIAYFWPWLLGYWMWRGSYHLITILAIGGAASIYIDNSHLIGAFAPITCAGCFLTILISNRIVFPTSAIRVANALGGISYPIYLFHFPLWILYYKLTNSSNPTHYAILLLAISALMYYFVEGVLVRKLVSLKPAAFGAKTLGGFQPGLH